MVAERITEVEQGDVWLSTTQAAREIGRTRDTMAEWCKRGWLVARRSTRQEGTNGVPWRLTRASLEDMLRRGTRRPRIMASRKEERCLGYPVLRAVCEALEVSRAALEGTERTPHLVEARRVAAVCLQKAGLGPTAIARLLQRDHSTVLHHLLVYATRPTPDEMWGVEEVQRLLTRPAAVTASLREQARAAAAGQRGGRG